MNENDLKDFGKNLIRMRQEKGISREELSRRSGVSSSSLIKYEKGEREPKNSTMRRIQAALGYEPDEPIMSMPYDEIHVYQETDLRLAVTHALEDLNVLGLKKVSDYIDDLIIIGKYRKWG